MLYVYRCGKCQRFLKYISAKPQRMYCANCDETYSLPQGGTIKLYKVHRGKKEGRSGKKNVSSYFPSLYMYNQYLSDVHSALPP